MVNVLTDVRTALRSSVSPRKPRILSADDLHNRLARIGSDEDRSSLSNFRQGVRSRWPLITQEEARRLTATLEERHDGRSDR